MESIDYKFLSEAINDKLNKSIKCTTCNTSVLQYFYSNINHYEFIKREFSKYELILWIKANELFIKRKTAPISQKEYKPRDIILAELGQNIGNELSYEHYCVVLKNEYNKVFVVPCSSSAINRAYDKSTGILHQEYFIGEETDGFSKKTVIMIREAKWISKSRVLTVHKNKISKTLFNEIYDATFRDIFESRSYAFDRVKAELERANQRIADLEQEKANFEVDYKILKGDFEKLVKDYGDIYSLIDEKTS